MAEYKMVCSSCGTLFASETTASKACPKCGGLVKYTGFTKEAFDSKTDEEKQAVVENARVGKLANISASAADTSFWISLVDIVASIFLALGILASLIIGFANMGWDAALGFGVLIGGTLATLLIVATIKIFVGAAKDLSYIRNHLEQSDK